MLISSLDAEYSDGEHIPENRNEYLHQNTPDDSIKNMTEELNKYDMKCEENGTEHDEHPTIGCFQIVGHCKPNHPVSYTISLDDDDEEQIILQNFRVADKKSQVSQEPKSFPSYGEGDGNSLSVLQAFSSSNFTRTHSPSYSTRSECAGSDGVSFIESAFQVFKNDKSSICSDSSSNFIALNPSRTELSPPQKIPKIPTIGHRIKFTPVFNCDDRIHPQMEPLGLQNDSDEEVEDDGIVSLSRMPVTCPISTCGSSSLPSDFFNHMASDHPYINIVKLSLFKVANFSICPAGNVVMCHQMFLVKKIRAFWKNKYFLNPSRLKVN